MGLEAGFGASRLGGTEKEKEEKISHMCESDGHWSLRDSCPKTEKTNYLVWNKRPLQGH